MKKLIIVTMALCTAVTLPLRASESPHKKLSSTVSISHCITATTPYTMTTHSLIATRKLPILNAPLPISMFPMMNQPGNLVALYTQKTKYTATNNYILAPHNSLISTIKTMPAPFISYRMNNKKNNTPRGALIAAAITFLTYEIDKATRQRKA